MHIEHVEVKICGHASSSSHVSFVHMEHVEVKSVAMRGQLSCLYCGMLLEIMQGMHVEKIVWHDVTITVQE